MTITVLCINPVYLPGIKHGGPVRTLSNMIAALGDEVTFKVVAADRDLGDTLPYPDIVPGQWYKHGKADVLYLAPKQRSLGSYLQTLNEIDYDVLYLNNYFATGCQYILFGKRCGLIPPKPLIMAPRGSFAPEALSSKVYKKTPTLWINRISGMLKHVLWHVTSDNEQRDLQRIVGQQGRIFNIPNLPAYPPQNVLQAEPPSKETGMARVAFLARVLPNKNLHYALERMQQVRGQIEYDIYGNIENQDYWAKCVSLIQMLPSNVQVNYCGVLPFDQVHAVLHQYHGLLLPTQFENFGHSILEAMSVGCIPVISDQTPWHNLTAQQAGWDISLQEADEFESALQQLVDMDGKTFQLWSKAAQGMALAALNDSEILQRTQEMFEQAAAMSQRAMR